MSERLAQSQCTGFVLASLGFVTFGFTGAYGFVLNVESLSNPKRRHSIAFDILAVLVSVPQAAFLFYFSTILFAYAIESRKASALLFSICYLTYWLFWLGWSIYRSVTVWPEIRRNREEDSQQRTRTPDDIHISDPSPVGLMPGVNPLDVAVRRIGE